MQLWVQVYSSLPTHRKTYALVEALKLKSNYEAVGIEVSLWLWAAVNAPDGDLTGFPSRAIANAVDWQKSPGKLVEGLEQASLLDRTDDGRLLIHDWEEYAMLLMNTLDKNREQTKERVRKYRERKQAENGSDVTACNVTDSVTGNVTVTQCNAPTKPNLTKHNNSLLSSIESNRECGEPLHASPKNPKKIFSKPTVQDVRGYCQENGYAVDPERFCDYYESNGWKVGKNPMENWKAAVRTWAKNQSGSMPVRQTRKGDGDELLDMINSGVFDK